MFPEYLRNITEIKSIAKGIYSAAVSIGTQKNKMLSDLTYQLFLMEGEDRWANILGIADVHEPRAVSESYVKFVLGQEKVITLEAIKTYVNFVTKSQKNVIEYDFDNRILTIKYALTSGEMKLVHKRVREYVPCGIAIDAKIL